MTAPLYFLDLEYQASDRITPIFLANPSAPRASLSVMRPQEIKLVAVENTHKGPELSDAAVEARRAIERFQASTAFLDDRPF